MKFVKMAAVLTMAGLLNACASNGNQVVIPDKNESSVALQITRSAGSGSVIEDQRLPEGAIDDVGFGGYIGSTLLGLPLGSMTTGFGLAILADQKYGWDRTNYIMYLNAEEFAGLDKVAMCSVVIKKMAETMPNSLERMQQISSTPLSEEIRFVKHRYNGGEELCADGYQLKSVDDSTGEIYFRPNEFFVGSMVGIRNVSEKINKEIFSSELQEQIPHKEVIAVRYTYQNSLIADKRYTGFTKNGFIGSDALVTSPFIKLPESTFISLPSKQTITTKKHIPFLNAVRNNDTVYYFVKPDNGEQYTLPLAVQHEKTVQVLDKAIANNN